MLRKVTIFGSGLMGSGIAQVAAAVGGYQVVLVDMKQELLDKAKGRIEGSVGKIAKKANGESEEGKKKAAEQISQTMGRITLSTDGDKAVQDTDLVIEAIVENLQVKQKLFERLDSIAPKHAIFTSNTSSLPIKDIARNTKRLERFGGLHFFNPVPIMKLLEVVRVIFFIFYFILFFIPKFKNQNK